MRRLRSTFTRATRAEEQRETRDMRHYVKKHIHEGNEGRRTARDMGHETVKKCIHKGIDWQTTYVLRETMGRTHYWSN